MKSVGQDAPWPAGKGLPPAAFFSRVSDPEIAGVMTPAPPGIHRFLPVSRIRKISRKA